MEEKKKIDVTLNCNNPQIIFTKEYILTYDDFSIYLYDLNGNVLDEYKNYSHLNRKICEIDNNKFASFGKNSLFKIEIINNKIEKTNIEIFDLFIKDILYIKKNNLLLIQFLSSIRIMDMDSMTIINKIYLDSLDYKPLSPLFKLFPLLLPKKQYEKYKLFNFNNEIFICNNQSSLFLFKIINGPKIYQLFVKIKIENIRGLIKINNKNFMIYNFKGLYEINTQNCKLKKISMPFCKAEDMDFIEKIKNNIYIYQNENLYLCNFSKNNLTLISLYKFDKKEAIKSLLNAYNPLIDYNIIIKMDLISIKIFDRAKIYYEYFIKTLTSAIIPNLEKYNNKIKMKEYEFKKLFLKKRTINFYAKNRNHNLDKNMKKKNYLNNKKNFKKNYR